MDTKTTRLPVDLIELAEAEGRERAGFLEQPLSSFAQPFNLTGQPALSLPRWRGPQTTSPHRVLGDRR